MAMLSQIVDMKPGECRWIGREDINVYCWQPCDLVMMPSGRQGWVRREATFKAWTADSVGSPWSADGWVSATAVVHQIKQLLTKGERDAA